MKTPRRGQIYRLKSDSVDKPRPVLIVSRTELNRGFYCTVVPFTSQQLEKRAALATCVLFEDGEAGLTRKCVAKTDDVTQVRFVDLRMAEGPLGEASPEKMAEISQSLAHSLDIT